MPLQQRLEMQIGRLIVQAEVLAEKVETLTAENEKLKAQEGLLKEELAKKGIDERQSD